MEWDGSDCCVGVNKDNAPNYYFVVWGVEISIRLADVHLKLYVNGCY